MIEAKSNLLFYLFYKFIFLYVALVLFLIQFKIERPDNSFLIRVFFAIIFISLHIFFSTRIYRAKVSRLGIKIGREFVKWEEIISVNRIHYFYLVKRKKGKSVIFPISGYPVGLFGTRVSDTDMDQIINLMIAKKKI